jgi:AcrR family transcriptional regulator
MPLQPSDARTSRDSLAPARTRLREGPVAGSRRSKGGRPTRQAAAELEQRILDTAADLFASQGFAATSMEQVAQVCGSGKDTIYRRYPSKARLFEALLEKLRTEVLSELDHCMNGGDISIERLRRFSRALLSINLRARMIALNRVALAEAVAFGGLRPTPAPRDPIMTRLAALVEEAQREGALSQAGDPMFVAEQLLYATSIKPLISRMLGDGQFLTADDEDSYFDRAWTLFMSGAASSIEGPHGNKCYGIRVGPRG